MVHSTRKFCMYLIGYGLFMLNKSMFVFADVCKKLAYSGNEEQRFVRNGKPNRRYYIHTPANYLNTEKDTKLILAFHGWGDSGKYYTHPEGNYKQNIKKILNLADEYNYAIVAFDGLTGYWGEGGSNAETYRSWTSGGTSTGLTPDGSPTCDITMSWQNPDEKVDLCYYSQCECTNRCGYSHCADDDIQMISDFITSGELGKKLCYDKNAIFAMGNSNGGIFTWNLGQDERTAKLLSGIAPIIAAPVCGYDFKTDTASVPAISLVGRKDPKHPVYTYTPETECVQSSKHEGGYRFVTSHKITSIWAQGAPGCNVIDIESFPARSYKYKGKDMNRLKCRTWCEGEAPFSLDCSYWGWHNDVPNNKAFPYRAAMMFFDSHLALNADTKV